VLFERCLLPQCVGRHARGVAFLQADRRERRVTGRKQEQRRQLEQLTRGRKRERSQDEDDNSDDDSDEDGEGDEATAAPATRAKAARRDRLQESSPPQHRLQGNRQSPSPRPSPVSGLVFSVMPCRSAASQPSSSVSDGLRQLMSRLFLGLQT